MADPDLVAAQLAISHLSGELATLTATPSVLQKLPGDLKFFELVKLRADRLNSECAQGQKRNRLECAVLELPAMLGQVALDMQNINASALNSTDQSALLDLIKSTVKLQDKVSGFTSRVQKT